MTVTINGTTGIQNPLGSASAPAESNTSNSNTGAYFPTGTTYAVATAGTNALYIDASQNVGIGTTSPGAKLQVSGNTLVPLTNSYYAYNANYGMGTPDSNGLQFFTAPSDTMRFGQRTGGVFTEQMRIDSSGNVGVGTSSPAAKLDVQSSTQRTSFTGTAAGVLNVKSTTATGDYASITFQGSGGNPAAKIAYQQTASGGTLSFGTSNDYGAGITNTAAVIDSSGNLLVGTTSPYLSTNSFYKASGASSPALYLLKNSSANTDQAFCVANGTSGATVSFQVLANGNAQNTNNSYGAISDAALKENIVDATPKLTDLMKVQIRNFNLKTDETKTKQIGVVAQELEAVFPSMVETNSDGIKSVKYSVFVPMLVKAIQELSAEVTALKAKVGA